MYSTIEEEKFPDGIAILGSDDSSEEYTRRKDIGRTIGYQETRKEIAIDKPGFPGCSWVWVYPA